MRNQFFKTAFKKSDSIESFAPEGHAALLKSHKITVDEYTRIKDAIGRAPTLTELGVFSAMWSEHCSYKSSRVHLRRLPSKGQAVVVGPGENAGIIRLKDKTCIAFKMESHNHPSFIEPYQGAATGVGGILRDVFCMGARPIANLNCLRYGAKDAPRMRLLVENTVKGIGDYGNCIGIPTVGGNISFDPAYNGNILINAMSVGVIHEDEIFKGYASGAGNLVIYIGSATGRDGIHGATMASDSFSTEGGGSRTTVQVGDPFAEKLLLEVTLELLKKKLVVGLQDMGAAGLTSSSFEMASRAGSGLFIDLSLVPVRAKNMTAYEMLLSESQERMLLVVTPEQWPKVKEIVEKWEIPNAVIGEVTDTGRVEICHNSFLEVNLPIGPVVDDAPLYDRPRKPDSAKNSRSIDSDFRVADIESQLKAILMATGSKQWIYEQYDQDIGTNTKYSSRDGGAAVVAVRPDWDTSAQSGIVISTACVERYCAADSRMGAIHAVMKCARMIAAAGGEAMAVTDCLNYGSATDPIVMQQISDGIDGISDACNKLSIPVISGNVSLYNETDGKHIHPTPMIGMVGSINDTRDARPGNIPNKQGEIYLVIPSSLKPTFNNSAAVKWSKDPVAKNSLIPTIDFEAESEGRTFVRNLNKDKSVLACRDVGDGGILTCAVKMLKSTNLGAVIDGSTTDDLSDAQWFLGEVAGAYLVAVESNAKINCSMTKNRWVRIGQYDQSLSDIRYGAHSSNKNELFLAFDNALAFVEK